MNKVVAGTLALSLGINVYFVFQTIDVGVTITYLKDHIMHLERNLTAATIIVDSGAFEENLAEKVKVEAAKNGLSLLDKGNASFLEEWQIKPLIGGRPQFETKY